MSNQKTCLHFKPNYNLEEELTSFWPPHQELKSRWDSLQRAMAGEGLDGILILQNADLIYTCGTTQVEAFYLPSGGKPLVLAKKPLDRVRQEVPWADPVVIPRGSALKDLLADHTPGGLSVLGLELDVLPFNYYRILAEKNLAGLVLKDASDAIRQTRAIKTDFELERLNFSAAATDAVYRQIPEVLCVGMTELELEAELLARFRAGGHQGIVRFRGFNQDLFLGHILSGSSGLVPAKVSSPTGGTGIGPGFGQGAGIRVIGPGELVSVDLTGAYGGYIVDLCRLFYTGAIPDRAAGVYQALLAMIEDLKTFIRPGAACGDVYQQSFLLAEKYGLDEGYMGLGRHRCPFIGHGIGLELDELPILARGRKEILRPGMVFALEPRVFLPGIGVIGLEDTYHLTEDGPEYISITERRLLQV